jgi:quercetin dioxygenase-like cupin family protein
MTRRVACLLAALPCLATSALAQTADPPKPPTEAVLWTLSEVKASEVRLAADPALAAKNSVLSIVPLGPGQSVRRTTFGKSGEAEIHGSTTDVFTILSGQAEFVVGGEIETPRTTNPGEIRGPSIKGGTSKRAATGDVVIVPPGVAHQILVDKGTLVTFSVTKLPR